MSHRLFVEWEIYHELEPFGEVRADIRSAALERALFNLLGRDAKNYPKGWPLAEFILRFGDAPDYAELARKEAKAKDDASEIPQWKRNKSLLWAIAHAWATDPKGVASVPKKNRVGTHNRKLGE